MYEFNWLLTLIFRQNETGKQTDRQRERQTDGKTDRQREQAQAQRYVFFSGVLGVSCCLLVCFALVCYGHLLPSTHDKLRFVLYYAYNIANI